MKNEECQGYFYLIPSKLVESGKSATKSLLYGLITSLSNKDGYCWGSNKYLAEKLRKNERTINRYLTELEKEGWIKREIKEKNKRRIYFLVRGMTKMSGGYDKNVRGVRQKCQGYNHSKSVKTAVDKETNEMEVEPSNKDSNINKYDYFEKILKRNNKQPYFLNMRIVEKGGKKWCIPNDNSQWLEFVGEKSEIEWK